METFQGKLDYTLNYKGMNLSAGEKQLICLARVLLQESKIVILDEPTAHVDPKTEQIIHETIREEKELEVGQATRYIYVRVCLLFTGV